MRRFATRKYVHGEGTKPTVPEPLAKSRCGILRKHGAPPAVASADLRAVKARNGHLFQEVKA